MKKPTFDPSPAMALILAVALAVYVLYVLFDVFLWRHFN